MTQETSSAEWTPAGAIRIKREIRSDMQRRAAQWRRRILLDLANLSDDGCPYFRRRLRFSGDPALKGDHAILKYREQLRKLWRGEADRGETLCDWLDYCRIEHLWTWAVSGWGDGTYSVEPNYEIFPLALAIAAGEWMPKMGTCGNPDCPAPYLLKARRRQQFCDRPACIAFGQREHKREWWRRVGVKRRAAQSKACKKRNSRERKPR